MHQISARFEILLLFKTTTCARFETVAFFEDESVQKVWQAHPELNQRTAAKSASDYNSFFTLNLVLNADKIRRIV